jgi:zinc transport system substrate-binding protein
MLRQFRYIFLTFGILCLSSPGGLARAGEAVHPAPIAVASIAPLHSLLANVMQGVGAPGLLMRPGTSPHDYVMRPSEALMLARADLVFWVGESGERGLLKPLTLSSKPARRMVALLDLPQVHPVVLRPVGPWSGGAKFSRDRASYLTDPHIWLDPGIASEIVAVMVAELSRIDPDHAAQYAKNGRLTRAKLDLLDQSLRRQLSPVKAVPYIVYHEAFQYFEQRYGLNNVGSVTDTSDVQPGARLILELKKTIRDKQVRCIFIEPQFSPSLVRILLQGTNVRVGVADDIGAGITPGPDAYFELMIRLGNSLASCLAGR